MTLSDKFIFFNIPVNLFRISSIFTSFQYKSWIISFPFSRKLSMASILLPITVRNLLFSQYSTIFALHNQVYPSLSSTRLSYLLHFCCASVKNLQYFYLSCKSWIISCFLDSLSCFQWILFYYQWLATDVFSFSNDQHSFHFTTMFIIVSSSTTLVGQLYLLQYSCDSAFNFWYVNLSCKSWIISIHFNGFHFSANDIVQNVLFSNIQLFFFSKPSLP